ncbi:MAG TPA: hypothetical protein VL371_03010 [Gemmataceae bacterium]|jgi:hypothetical protein|nr:hypothetical protein [Gemmataceae bacterium]
MSTLNPSRGFATALLFVVGACALAAAPPEARSATLSSLTSRATAVLAVEEFTWDAFVKFWKRQVGKTSGVVGVVALVGLGAMLLIMSKGRGN